MNILPGLATTALGREYQPFASLSSTNDYLKQNACRLPHGTVVAAAEQTAGKGRRGKSWQAFHGQCLAFSVLLHDWPLQQMGILPLLAGIAVCEGLWLHCNVSCMLKWSNDVLLQNRKLCGILCESRIAGQNGFAVVGIGINLTQTQEDFAHHDLVYANSLLLDTGKRFAPEPVAAAVLNSLEPLLDRCRSDGFAAVRGQYTQRCVTLGKSVRVLWDGEERTGVATGIADDGALLCEINGRTRSILAGEASVRGIYGYV